MRSEFKIPFVGLKLGKHDFNFVIGNTFFDSLGIDPSVLLVQKGDIKVALIFDKQQEDIFHLDFRLEGTLYLNCERCLDDFNLPILIQEKQWVKLGEVDFEDPNILVIPKNEFQLDLSLLLYEFISLSLPLIKVHPYDQNGFPTCNNDTAKIIQRFQPKDSNNQRDPRWEALKKLNIN